MSTNPTIATPQLPVPSYPTGISYLNLYGVLNEAQANYYEVKITHDPSLPVKNWAATDVDDTVPNVFYTLATSVQGSTRQVILPAKLVPFLTQPGQASTLNLPATAPSYPPYVITPVGVYLNDGGSQLPVNNTYFCTLAQAQAMAAEINCPNATITEYQPAPGPGNYTYVYAANETRRYYVFKDNDGEQQVAGILLWQMNALGVGRPGSFSKTANGWEWFPAPIPAPAPIPGPIFPMPMRQLLAGESIQSVSAGMGVMLFGPAAA